MLFAGGKNPVLTAVDNRSFFGCNHRFLPAEAAWNMVNLPDPDDAGTRESRTNRFPDRREPRWNRTGLLLFEFFLYHLSFLIRRKARNFVSSRPLFPIVRIINPAVRGLIDRADAERQFPAVDHPCRTRKIAAGRPFHAGVDRILRRRRSNCHAVLRPQNRRLGADSSRKHQKSE